MFFPSFRKICDRLPQREYLAKVSAFLSRSEITEPAGDRARAYFSYHLCESVGINLAIRSQRQEFFKE